MLLPDFGVDGDATVRRQPANLLSPEPMRFLVVDSGPLIKGIRLERIDAEHAAGHEREA